MCEITARSYDLLGDDADLGESYRTTRKAYIGISYADTCSVEIPPRPIGVQRSVLNLAHELSILRSSSLTLRYHLLVSSQGSGIYHLPPTTYY